MMRSLLYWVALTITCVSCMEDTGDNRSYLPANTGNQGEIVVVAPPVLWASDEANLLKKELLTLFEGLPADEPLFTSVEVSTEGFVDLFKTHRNILEFRIDPTNKTGALKRKDIYAKQQTQIIVNLNKLNDLPTFLENEFPGVLKEFHQAEISRLASRNRAFGDEKLKEEVLMLSGVSLILQEDFELAKQSPDFLWLRLDREKPIGGFQHQINQGIMIYQRPYSDTLQFSDTSLIAWKNNINKAFVEGPSTSYMSISNRYIAPVINTISFRGSAAKEMRGLWRMEGAKGVFMGGAFYAIAFYDPISKNQYFVEGYVYGPQFNKRSFIREIEAMVKSAKTTD